MTAGLCALVIGGASSAHLGAAESRESLRSARLVFEAWSEETTGCPVTAPDRLTARLFGYVTSFRVDVAAASIADVARGWQASGRASAHCIVSPRNARLPDSSFGARLLARTPTLDLWHLADSAGEARRLEVAVADLPADPTTEQLHRVLSTARSAADPCVAFRIAEALDRRGQPQPEPDVLSFAGACAATGTQPAGENLLSRAGWSRDPAWHIQSAHLEPDAGQWHFRFDQGDDWRSMVQAGTLGAGGVFVLQADVAGSALADVLAVELSDGRNLAAARSHQLGAAETFRLAFRGPATGGTAAVFPVLFRGPGEAHVTNVRLTQVSTLVRSTP